MRSGREFELVCKKIFSAHYPEVELTQESRDLGRDLIVLTDEGGKIFVECKYRTKGVVGRSAVQKLHSAVITGGATKGILVTNSRFSKEALEYAKSTRPQIELMDLSNLLDLASRAGLELLISGEKQEILTFPVFEEDRFFDLLVGYLRNHLFSAPKNLEDVVEIVSREIWFHPIYLANYSIDATFKTASGELLHKEEGDGLIVFDGAVGKAYSEFADAEFFDAKKIKFSKELAEKYRTTLFKIPLSEVELRITDSVCERHTKEITYYRGRRVYFKTCEPKSSDVLVYGIKQMYVPFSKTTFSLNGKRRFLTLMENGTDTFYVLNQNISKCEVCGEEFETGLLCNSCGTITHLPFEDVPSSHGFYCSDCGKTVCRNCAGYYRKFLFSKIPVCDECASIRAAAGKRIKKFA